jgi:hypothetical protein
MCGLVFHYTGDFEGGMTYLKSFVFRCCTRAGAGVPVGGPDASNDILAWNMILGIYLG